MRLCIKHNSFIDRRIKAKTKDEILLIKHELIRDLLIQHSTPQNMDHIQNRIHKTKSECPGCFFKKSGNDMLLLLISRYTRERKKIVLARNYE